MPKLSSIEEFIEIQEMQFKLDNLKKKSSEINKEIKSLQFTIPKKLRGLILK